MMSVVERDELQGLLATLNIDNSHSFSDDKKVEKLVFQLGDLSSRYSDLATRYLKLVNSKVSPSIEGNTLGPTLPNSSLQKTINDLFSEFSSELSDCIAPSLFNAGTGKFSGDHAKALRSIMQSLKTKKVENFNLTEVIKSLEQKCENFQLAIKQIETDKLKLTESKIRNEFFVEFEGLIKEDLKKTHILQQKITESLVLIKNNQMTGDSSHIDAIFDSLLTELNLQEHLKKMIEKMNSRRLKQDQEIDSLCEKLSSMESTVIQCERDKMLYLNQKRLFENEKQELQDKIQKINDQIKEEHASIQKLQIEIEHKKNAYSALNKAYEMNKNTLDQMKRKDSMVKNHISLQDSDINKLKQRGSDQEKLIKSLREEIQQKTQTIIALSSDKDKLSDQARISLSLSSQVEESNKRLQSISAAHDIEVNKLEGLLRSKQEEKDQIVSAYSKLIKGYEGIKREFGLIKNDNGKLRDKLDRLKLQHIPSELKKELEKELEIVRTENIRLRDTLESMEVERKKWRNLTELDGSNAVSMSSKIAALEAENQELRRIQTINGSESSLLVEERKRNRMLETECERLNRKVWELSEQINRVNDEQYRVAELLRNNWSSQSIRIEDRTADASFATPLDSKIQPIRYSGDSNFFDVSKSVPSNDSDFVSESNYFEDENKRLMEIVAQVKSDLRQASSQSPAASIFSP